MSSEVDEIVKDDVIQATKLLEEVPTPVNGDLDTVNTVMGKVKADEMRMEKGISFLDVKNLNLLNYISNLTYLILRKLSGEKIEDDASVDRLIELRVMMEKMKPIDEKLRYQVKKLLSSAASDPNDPLRFRADPDNMIAKEDMEDDSDGEKQKKPNVYVPPKIAPAYYDGDDTLEVRKQKMLERAQKRALSSTMLHELRQQYDTGPEEIRESIDPTKIKLNEEMKERARYEEDYMLRLPMTKKQKHEMRQMTTVTNFSTKFGNIAALDLKPEDMTLTKKSSSKKKAWKKKGKKGFKKKRH